MRATNYPISKLIYIHYTVSTQYKQNVRRVELHASLQYAEK